MELSIQLHTIKSGWYFIILSGYRLSFKLNNSNLHTQLQIPVFNQSSNIGIIHVFHALSFAGSRGSCLNMRLLGRVIKYRLRDLASVNAMKQTCVIVILAYLT